MEGVPAGFLEGFENFLSHVYTFVRKCVRQYRKKKDPKGYFKSCYRRRRLERLRKKL